MQASNDPAALSQLVDNAEFLQRLARQLVGDEHQAEDLVQDAYVAALEQGPRERLALGAWLGKVLRNRAFNEQRGSARRSQREKDSAKPESQGGDASALAGLDMQRRVFDALMALSEPQRTVLYLRYYEGLAPGEIAQRLNAPLKTVKTRLTRGLAAIRQRLDAKVAGGRDTWLAALAPIAFPDLGKLAGATSAVGAGALGSSGILWGVTIKSILWIGALLLATLGIWQGTRDSELLQGPGGQTPAAALQQELGQNENADRSTLAARDLSKTKVERIVLPTTTNSAQTDPKLGSLKITLTWPDGSPAAGMLVRARCKFTKDQRHSYLEANADQQGQLLFQGLQAGRIYLHTGFGHHDDKRSINAGERTELVWKLPEGIDVKGQVCDRAGKPVKGAEIWMSDEFSPPNRPSSSLAARTTSEGFY